jgi:hypothetical protein
VGVHRKTFALPRHPHQVSEVTLTRREGPCGLPA